ncbi:MAG: hypothetical protein J0I06_11810, partial [Planctomycetes bacterium]|nr:hypothetical protein [Planctomycetota bacterium]
MPVVEVSCPNCGTKFKAPDNMAGKKARCKKCNTAFRIPGVPLAESVGDADVPVADLIDEGPSAVPPAKSAAALPSADAFDFGKPAAKPAPAPPAAKSAPSGPVPAPPARPAFGTAKAEAAPKPAPAKPAPAPAPPAKPAAAAPAARPPSKSPEPLPLDDEPPPPRPAAPPEPAPAADADPFAFSEEPARPAKSKRRDEDEDAPRKKRRDEDEDERPAKSKRRDEDAPKKKRRDEDEDERPAKSKAPADDEPYNPFANYPSDPEPEPEKKSKKRRADDDEDPKARKTRGDEGDEDESAKPRYRRPDERGGSKILLIVGALGAFALGLGVVAAVVYIKNNRKPPEAEVKKDEKKEEPPPVVPPDPPRPDAPKVDPKAEPSKVEPKVDPKVEPKPKDKVDPKAEPPKVEPVRPKDPGPTRATIALPPNLKTFSVAGLPAKPSQADRPRGGGTLDAPAAGVRRVFPPFDKTADTCVLVQTSAPLMGKGEKLVLDSYGPSGNRVPDARIEYDGDGSPDPIADLYASGDGAHFLAAVDGKLHVWALADKKKLADGLDPYADKPEHAKAGLAAAFLTTKPGVVVTVSTAGAVHLYDVLNRKTVSEFVPPNGAPGRVALGRSAAKAGGNGSVAVAVGGVLYQLEAKEGLRELRKYDLTGDVGRSLGLAVSGTPGRLLYAFETAPDKSGKKDLAVFGLPLGDAA